jgi:hypothetical protein
MYNNTGLIKSFTPTAAIVPFSAVKFGADDNTITLATAAADLVIGFTNEIEVVADDIAKGKDSVKNNFPIRSFCSHGLVIP